MFPIVFHEDYEVDIGGHVFPTAKYRLVQDRLLREGVIVPDNLHRAPAAQDEDILRVHTPEWVAKLKTGELSPRERMTLEVPYSQALRDAAWLCSGGSILTGQLALKHGVAVHLGGGFHHAFPGHGEGFCPLNDAAVAVQRLRADREIERAMVIDCDVHHGNGTAAVFEGDSGVFTFSMHQENNYPLFKPAGDLDLGLDDGTGDTEYLALLERHLPECLEEQAPEFAFYLAGADPYREDQLGGLGLTLDGLRERDDFVLHTLAAAGIPAGLLLAGGYAWNTQDTVSIHCGSVAAAGAAQKAWRAADSNDRASRREPRPR
jgi:acetoin utilization deacetylase AcuC-like enzyme